MAPITDCIKGKNFHWNEAAENAFTCIKQKLISAPILILPDFNTPFEIHSDASKVGIGAVLSQDGRPVAYFSEKLTGPRSRYCAYDVEFYAVVRAVRHWRHYLFQREFILFTDHDSLKYLSSQDNVSSRHASWASYLQQFNFVIRHKYGSLNRVADALSRRSALLVEMKVSVPGFDDFATLYATDPYFSKVLSQVQGGDTSKFTISDGEPSKIIFVYTRQTAKINDTISHDKLDGYCVDGADPEVL
ncbi:retrovirus-related pol polyprotein from transposon gypsy [Phtheirospermum japonicum]|uniref:Retrovirus-related pol polyprotein from transposon gypsy n=1 Tax=Phtheirospermum japonicum TaxID=374723 RepID=A0A830BLG3_9LAMI|nr:retrovirus-related pol polyprotein from transposon gypsy [Phtheirospermum japonicum]